MKQRNEWRYAYMQLYWTYQKICELARTYTDKISSSLPGNWWDQTIEQKKWIFSGLHGYLLQKARIQEEKPSRSNQEDARKKTEKNLDGKKHYSITVIIVNRENESIYKFEKNPWLIPWLIVSNLYEACIPIHETSSFTSSPPNFPESVEHAKRHFYL